MYPKLTTAIHLPLHINLHVLTLINERLWMRSIRQGVLKREIKRDEDSMVC